MSQVVLSIVLPIPMVALLLLTARRDVMGGFVNKRLTTVIAVLAAALVLALNLVLLAQTAGISIPYLRLE
jgi:manganese transport protein